MMYLKIKEQVNFNWWSRVALIVVFVSLAMFVSSQANAQEEFGYVEIVRNGPNKPGIVEHGMYVKIRLKNGQKVKGYVNEVRAKTLELSSSSIPYQNIYSIDLNKKGKRVVKHIGMYTALGGLNLVALIVPTTLQALVITGVPVVVGAVIMIMSSAIPSKYAMNRGWYLKVHPDKVAEIQETDEDNE